jgi:hypothetical protein
MSEIKGAVPLVKVGKFKRKMVRVIDLYDYVESLKSQSKRGRPPKKSITEKRGAF